MTGLEINGLIDVKVPSQGRKFGLWKAWRRQWCVVRRSQENTLQLVLGRGHNYPTSCIDIPYNAVLCRSESRSRNFAFGIYCPSSTSCLRQPIIFLAGRSESDSQKWMLRIRSLISLPKIPAEAEEFTISLIDNSHSRKAGLAGLYGTLSTGVTGITVSDPSTGQARVHWRWGHLASMSVRPTNTLEDANHVLVLNTSSEFSCGEGELKIFCLEAPRLENLLSKFQTKPQFRLISSPLPPLPSPAYHALLAARRRSRSEGDLRCWPQDSNFSLFHLRTQSMSRNTSQDKVASTLLNAGIGLMLTTPGCSEPDSLHDYQCLDALWPPVEQFEDTVPDLPELSQNPYSTSRRESGVSVASGIYEEIEDLPDTVESTTNVEEDSGPIPPPPPPLPPRKTEERGLENDVSDQSESNVYTVTDDNREEPLYLPMSPAGRKEETYVVMANLINKTSHISEPVV